MTIILLRKLDLILYAITIVFNSQSCLQGPLMGRSLHADGH